MNDESNAGVGTANPYEWADIRRTGWILVRIAVILALVVGALSRLDRMYEEKFYGKTGDAEWIWIDRDPLARRPVAFFAVRNFTLASPVRLVTLKIAAEPSYEIWFDGQQIARHAPGRSVVDLDVYDLTKLARPGTNRIVVGLRSANGIGGCLAGIDVGADRQNEIVTDSSWRIFDRWSAALPEKDPRHFASENPLLLGRPPSGRWNFPDAVDRTIEAPPEHEIQAVSRREVQTRIPVVKIVSGVAVLAGRELPATVLDFGHVQGWGVVGRQRKGTEAVLVRYLASIDQLRVEASPERLVIARGEPFVVDPEERRFRYMVVYEQDAKAWLLSMTPVRR